MGEGHRAEAGGVVCRRGEECLEGRHDGGDGGHGWHGFRLGDVVVDGVGVRDVVGHCPIAGVDQVVGADLRKKGQVLKPVVPQNPL